ncbi:MAG: DUF3426 domain-containing protein [Pseudomonadota bacterium]
MATEALQTRCPECHTVFEVDPATLARADGKVRCGDCLHVFNARDEAVEPSVLSELESTPDAALAPISAVEPELHFGPTPGPEPEPPLPLESTPELELEVEPESQPEPELQLQSEPEPEPEPEPDNFVAPEPLPEIEAEWDDLLDELTDPAAQVVATDSAPDQNPTQIPESKPALEPEPEIVLSLEPTPEHMAESDIGLENDSDVEPAPTEPVQSDNDETGYVVESGYPEDRLFDRDTVDREPSALTPEAVKQTLDFQLQEDDKPAQSNSVDLDLSRANDDAEPTDSDPADSLIARTDESISKPLNPGAFDQVSLTDMLKAGSEFANTPPKLDPEPEQDPQEQSAEPPEPQRQTKPVGVVAQLEQAELEHESAPPPEATVMEADRYTSTTIGESTDEPPGQSDADADELAASLLLADEVMPPRQPQGIWIGLSVIALMGLAIQVVHAFRGTLATMPQVSEPLVQVYDALSLPLTPQWPITQLCTERHAVVETDGALAVETAIVNRATQRLPMPLLRVRMTDAYGETIASTLVEPDTYLGGSDTSTQWLAAGTRVTAFTTLKLDAGRLENYTLSLCYRNAGQTLRCASQCEPASP